MHLTLQVPQASRPFRFGVICRSMDAVVLCFHKVGSQKKEGRRLNIDPQRLDTHIRYFARRKFQFLRAGDFRHWPERKSVCFTFDDAYASTIEYGLPVFERNNVPMTLYAVTRLVGMSSSWDGELARPLADWQALKYAQARGHEIGNHTANHVHLPRLSFEDQKAEISQAHEDLLSHGIEGNSICYPYGHQDNQSQLAASQIGYEVGMALGKRPARPNDPRLAIPRIVIAFSDALPMLLYKMHLRPKLK